MTRGPENMTARPEKGLGMTSMVEIYFDGLCEPKNPGGIPIYAFTIADPMTGQFLAQQAGLAGEPWNENATHNLGTPSQITEDSPLVRSTNEVTRRTRLESCLDPPREEHTSRQARQRFLRGVLHQAPRQDSANHERKRSYRVTRPSM